MSRRLIVCGVLTLSAFGISRAGEADLKPGRTHDPAIIRRRNGTDVGSTNWSGYAVTAPTGSVTAVSGSWTVPAVTCGSATQYSSFWVGIDGYSSNTVEQIGTDSDCQNGQPLYYAWFEFYPHPSFTIGSKTMTVRPGDIISATVSASKNGTFTVTIQDGVQSFSTTTKTPQAKQSSAEWIAEAPSGGGVLPLANFGTVLFNGPCETMISGKTSPIGSLAWDQITMEDNSGVTKAAPSALSSSSNGVPGSSFSVTFVNSQ